VAHILDSFGAIDRLVDFTSTFGRRFYHREVTAGAPKVVLKKTPMKIQAAFTSGQQTLVPFLAEKTIEWSIYEL